MSFLLLPCQYYCCKKEESESEEEEPDFAVTSRLPPVHSNHNLLAASAATTTAGHAIGLGGGGGGIATANGPVTLFTPPLTRKLTRSHTFCPSCTSRYELPFYLQPPPSVPPVVEGNLRNGGERLSYRAVQQQDLQLPVEMPVPRYTHLHHQQSLHIPQPLHQPAPGSKLNLTPVPCSSPC